jgi:hypothetical protein
MADPMGNVVRFFRPEKQARGAPLASPAPDDRGIDLFSDQIQRDIAGIVASGGLLMRLLDDLLCHLDEVDRVIAAMSDNQAQRSLRHQADLNRQALLKASHELSLQIQQMGSFCGLMHGAIATRPCGPTTH